jgi:hypothetical protein
VLRSPRIDGVCLAAFDRENGIAYGYREYQRGGQTPDVYASDI